VEKVLPNQTFLREGIPTQWQNQFVSLFDKKSWGREECLHTSGDWDFHKKFTSSKFENPKAAD
jgi:hypothetical protein